MAAAPTVTADGRPISTLVCTSCGAKNRIAPAEKGSPHCGKCGTVLPWLVNATDATCALEGGTGALALVDLWAPWCGPCRFVGPILEQLSREYPGRLKVVKVNVDENPALASRFQATSIPTLVVLRDGKQVDRVVGALPKQDLVARLTPFLLRT